MSNVKTEINRTVQQIQAGELHQWNSLYAALSTHKKKMVNSYCRKFSATLTTADIEAAYDDCLMIAVEKFDSEASDCFEAFLSTLFIKRIYKLQEYATRKKRGWTVEADSSADESQTRKRCLVESLNAITQSSDGQQLELGAAIPDMETVHLINERVDAEMTVELLQSYATNKKRHEQAKLIAVEMNCFDLAQAERRNLLMSVVSEGTSEASMRKKLQRAKADFKLFLANSAIPVTELTATRN